VAFIPKPGKKDYSDPKALRPICLTSFLLKILERLIDWFIKEEVLTKFPLHEAQFAYRRGIGTEVALHQLVSRLEKAVVDEGQYVCICFLDVEGAFSNAFIRIMIKALLKIKVPKNIILWIQHMLLRRTACVKYGGVTCEWAVERGTPQGGVLSPLIWVAITNVLLKDLDESSPAVYKQSWSDDLTVLAIGVDPDTVRGLVQGALDRVEKWAGDTGVKISAPKSEYMMMSLKKGTESRPLEIGKQQIPKKKEVKHLGIILHSKLNWSPHIERQTQKATYIMLQAKRAMGKTWGLSPKVTLWCYTAIVRPIMMYGVVVWAAALKKKITIEKLTRVQRLACLMTTGAMGSTPTKAMEVILNLPPIELFLMGEAVKAYHRIESIGLWRRRERTAGRGLKTKGHVDTVQEMARKIGLVERENDRMAYKMLFEKGYNVYIDTGRQDEDEEADVVCYTDGSRREERTGAGGFIRTQGDLEELWTLSEPMGKDNTVFQAEMQAIKRTAEQLSLMETRGKKIVIYSDSQASLKALRGHKFKSKHTWNTAQSLRQVAEHNNVEVRWVKGHAGIAGNERADELAGKATRQNEQEEVTEVPISQATIKTAVEEWVVEEHTKWWSREKRYKAAREAMDRPTKTRTTEAIKAGRALIRQLTAILTGHSTLRGHLHKIKLSESPNCKKCGKEETVIHFMGKCPAYAKSRMETMGWWVLDREELNKIPIWKQVAFLRKTKRLEYEGGHWVYVR
jgi:ribonuclease HI